MQALSLRRITLNCLPIYAGESLYIYNSADANKQTVPEAENICTANAGLVEKDGFELSGILSITLYGVGLSKVGVPVYGLKPSSTDHELLPDGIVVVGLVLMVTGKDIGAIKFPVANLQNPPKVELFEPVETKAKQYL